MAATNVSRNILTPGLASLRSYLQSELNVLRKAPILLISSEVGASSSKLKPVADSCQWVKFTLGQQFGMRTVPTTISSAFPTKDSLEQTLELMQRTGASSIVSVGSGSAIDLAKAVATTVQVDQERKTPLILVPTTYSGLVAAGSSHSLFLDGNEDTLVPLPHRHQQIIATADGSSTYATVSTLDPQKYMENLDEDKFDVLLYAISAILLDAGSRKSTYPSLPTLLQATIDLISLRNSPGWDQNEQLLAAIPSLTNLLYQSAGSVSYGLSDGFEEEDNRSITIALASSLIPTLFPEIHPISFIASLVPGLCHYYSIQGETVTNDNEKVNDKFRTLVQQLQEQSSGRGMGPPPSLETRDESLQGFSIPDMAVSHIQSNQAVWKPLDVPDDVLVQVLQHSLKQ
eukprot:CAMPEP_0168195440 /NCGR_PEP_ID=MMETSP0139_2-20121125/19849_1 /TAXON_ID=44445 /ORGANISM="Pseudo-nitzschia australis, Strain 10249 10 AB" /LENGTH=400 /DNA_ID=CAMNT_0008119279 /DNA_START=50 /DNA_END=1252 /DNA_ORIENTATION=+